MEDSTNVQVEELTSDDVFKKYNQIYLSEGGLFKSYQLMVWDKLFKKLGTNPSKDHINSIWEELKINMWQEETMARYGGTVDIWRLGLVQVFANLVGELWPDRAVEYKALRKDLDSRGSFY